MRKILSLVTAFVILFIHFNYGNISKVKGLETETHIIITVNETNFDAVLYDTESAKTFLSMLPMTIEMNELNSNEKYHYLDKTLPTSSESVGQIHTGDLMLYGNSCVVLFYKDFKTSYSYTKLGYITDTTDLQNTLGTGNVTVTYSKVSNDGFVLNDDSSLTISDKYIYGDLFLKADETEVLSQFKNNSIHIEKTGKKIGTGSKLVLIENNTVTSELTVVIFGDVNGDGECDAQDAVIVSCIVFGLISLSDLNEEYRIAADCNQDGNIDKSDSSLLIETGLKLKEISQTPTQTEEKSDILVVYFSATGTTETIANYAAAALSADIYEIEAEVPYTAADLAYYTGCRADKEQSDPTARPAISGSVDNMSQYKTILLGYPIWHGQAPKIIYTFLESYDLSGKTIIPFCTSHSSGIGSSATNLHSLAPNSQWNSGRRFANGTSEAQIVSWLQALTLISTEKFKRW
ncbi:MAG: hypothetical protein IJT03_08440 [Clostridia bacterium]|nr:hypothetical protein [Clostridia bacterium]